MTILGMPNLRPSACNRVKIGNLQMRFTAHIIRICASLGIPCMFENPHTSMMWIAPAIARVSQSPYCSEFVFDQCQLGTRWRKRTRILGWHVISCDALVQKCEGRKGVCSLTNLPHIVLTGSCKSNNKLWTSIAQEYPLSMCCHST